MDYETRTLLNEANKRTHEALLTAIIIGAAAFATQAIVFGITVAHIATDK